MSSSQPQQRRAASSSSSSSSSSPSSPSSSSSSPARGGDKPRKQILDPRPSSSVVLLSPTNEVLLLHRVKSSSTFASAHVFPGGNLDAFHDGDVPPVGDPARHQDGPAYRLGAVRECFEETGILLAKKDGALIELPVDQRDDMRKKVHANEVNFVDWVKSLGGEPDTAGLVPFTRWITPVGGPPKRFTTQMYVYMLPISRTKVPSEMFIPTADGGVEHTAAQFAPATAWLERARAGSLIVFPPQYFLLHMLSRFLTGGTASLEEGPLHFTAQRKKLRAFLRRVPTADTDEGRAHPTAAIPWADKVMCPHHFKIRESDGRVVLGLDKPGPELEGSQRAGDWERVMLVKFGPGGARDVEVRLRADVLKEERAAEAGQNAKL
ncbi:NUDIX hydrolase domain-containingprotein [Purpureocillium lavendulum]|uniref:NUDIX hydrolase domain-containingprotein n=1 Tax=Purpureocillium lavendulum TaxID=1247861 RepID=A0AB34FXN1_9HYPO|nr:NUDIX hydrolase domain-containingprotein [Purpureocillium lavendulum]